MAPSPFEDGRTFDGSICKHRAIPRNASKAESAPQTRLVWPGSCNYAGRSRRARDACRTSRLAHVWERTRKSARTRTSARGSMMPTKEDVHVKVKVSWCKGCGLCVAYCNRGVLEMKGVLPAVLHAEKCSRCLQ